MPVTTTAPPISRPRTSALDGVRGVAVAGVVLYHTAQLATPATSSHASLFAVSRLFAAGRFGVDLFFVLSGFLLLTSWESLRRRVGGRRALRPFAGRRLRRIAPAYWVSVLVLVPVVAPELLHSLHHLVLLFSFQQYLDPHLAGRVNVVYWSLTTEVHFYLLVPLLAALLRRAGAARSLFLAFTFTFAWRLVVKHDLPASWIPGRIDEFMAGMVAASIVADPARRQWRRVADLVSRRSTAMVLGGSLVVLALAAGPASGTPGLVAPPAIGALIAVLLVHVLLSGRTKGLETQALRGLGTVSYSLYLWHYPVIAAVLREFGRSWFSVLVALGCALTVAVVSYALVERRFMNATSHGRVEGAADERRREVPELRGRRALVHLEPVPGAVDLVELDLRV